MVETRVSICKICPACCPLEVTVEDGRAVKVAGNRQSPLYGGYTCPKGRAMPEAHYSPHRILHPQKRMPDGSYVSISMERALDEIAARLKAIVDEHGPRGVAVYPGNGGVSNPLNPYMGANFIMALGAYPDRFFSVQTIDQPGKVIAQALHGRWIAGPNRFHDSDCWMLVGANPVISKMGLPINPGQVIKRTVKNGMKLIVVDPRASESAIHAFLHIQPRPGQDLWLLAGMLNVILTEQLYDTEFVAQETQGIDALKEAVARFTPEIVSQIADVPVEQILQAARTFAGARRGCVVTGTAPHFALHGTLLEYIALCINTVCGRWQRAGEENGHPHVLLPEVEVRAQPLAPYQPWDDNVRGRIHGLPRTVLGGATGTLAEEILTPGEGQVRALICSGSNPMVSMPDQLRIGRALKSLDLLISLDVEMSNTARMADYIIPDKQGLETPACTQFTESMKYYGLWTQGFEHPWAMYAPAVVDPPAGSDVIEIWEFYYEIAQRLGIPLTYWANPAGTGQHWEKPPVPFELDMTRRPTTEEMFEKMCVGSRVPLEEVKKHPHGRLFDDLDNIVLPRDPACAARLELGDAHMIDQLAQLFAERGGKVVADGEYPLLMTARRRNEVLNSIGRMNPRLVGRQPYNPAYLSPVDLDKYGIRAGELIRIRSRHGEIVGVAEPEATLRPGTLSMSHCFGANPDEAADPLVQGACSSRLMDANAEFDPLFGQPRMSAVPVAISRWEQATAAE